MDRKEEPTLKPYRRYRRLRYEATTIAQLSPEERRRYFREAKAAQRARHKGVVHAPVISR